MTQKQTLKKRELLKTNKTPQNPMVQPYLGSSGVLIAQSCSTLCDPMDCRPSVHGIFQTRILEWLSFPSPGYLPDLGIKSRFLALQADSLPSEPPWKHLGRRFEKSYDQSPRSLASLASLLALLIPSLSPT